METRPTSSTLFPFSWSTWCSQPSTKAGPRRQPIILVVPIALVGVLVALWVRGYETDLYTQVGLVLMIALASKNAILIVEFARELHLGGMSVTEAAIEATRRRFRPILMTSFAFILGVFPLVVAFGAGAASQRALGTVVFGGMIASTLLAIPFVPVFFVLMERLSERIHPRAKTGIALVEWDSFKDDLKPPPTPFLTSIVHPQTSWWFFP